MNYFMGDIIEFNLSNVRRTLVKKGGKVFIRRSFLRNIKSPLLNAIETKQFAPTAKYLRKFEGFTDREVRVITDYLQGGYKRFGDYEPDRITKLANEKIRTILNKLPLPEIKPHTKFTRYVPISYDELDDVVSDFTTKGIVDNGRFINREGVITLSTPMSTSKTEKQAKFFSKRDSDSHGLLKFEIKPKKQTKSRDVEMFKEHTYIDEGEMLYPKGSKFKIQGVVDKNGDGTEYVIKLKEL